MTVFLGNNGRVELQRQSQPMRMVITTTKTDNDTFTARFERELGDPLFYGSFITGDRVELRAETGATPQLDWIQGVTARTGTYFVHVDQLGALRLYTTFQGSLRGQISEAVPLANLTGTPTVTVTNMSTDYRQLAQVTSYELSTSREAIDVTALSEEYRTQLSGLMSGSGRLTCIWDYANVRLGTSDLETAQYLLQLVTRTQVGGQFNAQLYLKTDTDNPSGSTATRTDKLYYRVNALVTNAAVAFQVDSRVEATLDFVTTGQIQLRYDSDSLIDLALPGGNTIGTGQGTSNLADTPVTT
jgi:hypothetical protein